MSKRMKVIDNNGQEKQPGISLNNITDGDTVFRKRRNRWVVIPKKWLGKTPKMGIMQGGWKSKYNLRKRK